MPLPPAALEAPPARVAAAPVEAVEIAPPVDAVVTRREPRTPLELSLLFGRMARLRGDFEPALGWGADLRVRAGRAWAQVSASSDAATTVADLGRAGAARVGGLVGGEQALWSGGAVGLGAGAFTQAWRVEDLDGTHRAWGAELRAQLAVEQGLNPWLGVQAGVAPAFDLQRVEVLGAPVEPSRWTSEFFLKVRCGR
jgi:hypothetical protein